MNVSALNPPIGCFGGTFNPPHVAHLALVHAACLQLQLAQVLMIPAGQPWQKPQVLPAHHRVKMLEAALEYDKSLWQSQLTNQNTPYPLQLDPLEANLSESSYTITTLKTLRQRYPKTPLVWIMGSDQLSNLHTWRDWQDLLNYAHIAVAQRANHHVAPAELIDPIRQLYAERVTNDPTQWQGTLCGHFIPFTLPALQISSSAIRAELQRGTDPDQMSTLPPTVAHYISTHHLYQDVL